MTAIALEGTVGTPVTVQASINDGLPGIDLVGLPDTAVNESRKRIRAAVQNHRIFETAQKVTVNLSPGNVPKTGTAFDLGIALAILEADGRIPAHAGHGIVMCGEVGLDGRLHPVRGVLPMVQAGVHHGFHRFVVPHANGDEARLVPGVEVAAVVSLSEAMDVLGADVRVPEEDPVPATAGSAPAGAPETHDLAEIKGQGEARLGLEVAAAGGHHMLMVGTPGAGKTLLAQCLPGILPPLDDEAALDVATLRSLDGTMDARTGLDRCPPFQSPHHRASSSAMLGGRRPGTIGVFSRSHHGVLFMDEAPEFSRDVLEAMRQPLESGEVHVHRAWGSTVLPARFQLVLAANPCPCGANTTRNALSCTCSPLEKKRYRNRLSGPVLDRVDIRLEVDPVTAADLHSTAPVEDSRTVAARVATARSAQLTRWRESAVARDAARERGRSRPWRTNAEVPGSVIRAHFRFTPRETDLLERQLETGALTMRGFDRVLRLATTLADMRGAERPAADDLYTAVLMRTREAR
ncbi:YifB family Mg chelatase-like AAA ATPase [Brevibacterium litoralis]|uniref:YifB family Mg chelatase-like AAA ATPase n=1 Tax=Brevibacterium litoralis TaxID=3138935 RepID=UPI0032EC907F